MSMMGGGGNTATFYITGNAQGAVNAASQATGALAQLSGMATNTWFGLQNLGTAFAAFPAAVAAGLGSAINSTIEWQDAMFDLERTTGESGAAVKAIADDILDVARNTPLATQEIAALAASGAQLGIANDALAQYAETMGILISATDLTASNTADFARVMNVFQVPTGQIDNFASALLEVGRNTAATESEILNVTKRISGAAAAAGIGADAALGLGAALVSLGPRAEAGGTAMNKTINDMVRAVSTGGDNLERFAAVANMTTDQFATLFREDAAGAVAAFVTGLGRLSGGAEAQISILDDLGITEQRQVSALQQLAQGTKDVGNTQRDLNAILGFSQSSWATSTALQDVAEAKARTLSGQMQLLRNAIFEFGTSIGQFMVGPLGFLIQRFIDFLAGVEALPTPLKVLFAGLIGIMTAITGLAAAAFLIGPRLLLAADAFNRLRQGSVGAASGLASTSAAAQATTQSLLQAQMAANGATTAFIGFRNAQGQMIAGQQVIASTTSATVAAGNAASGAAVATSRFSAALGTLGKVAGWVGAALTVLTIVTTILGNKQRQQAEAAERALQANEDLVSIMRQSGETAGVAAMQWLQAQPAYINAAAAAQALGIQLATLNAIVTGQSSPQQMDEFVTALRNGGEEAAAFGRQVLDLATIYKNSADASGVMVTQIDAGTEAFDNEAEAVQKDNDELREQVRILEGIARAYIDLADATVASRDAQFALQDAQEAYNEALAESLDTASAVTQAELELAQAQLGVARAQREVAEAEEDVATARVRAAEEVREAQRDVADSQDRYLDSLDRVQKAEDELAELRLGPASDEYRDATNDLRNAELRLARAHQTVADAEWYLQHLREEGASARDITDAEMALAESRQEVADTEAELSDATEKLNDLRDESKQAERIADAERDLQSAVRDSERALNTLRDSQEALGDARERQANDTAYQEAQEHLIDTQLAVRQATLDVVDAERELEEIRAGRAEKDAARAAAELETQLIRMAQANAEVRRQTALANGQTWDSGDAAHALADELQALIGLAPDAASQQRLQEYIDTLRAAPNVPDAPTDNGSADVEFNPEDFGLPPLGAFQDYFDELNRIIEESTADAGGGKSIWDQFFGSPGSGALTGAGIGALIAGPIGAAVGGVVGALIGALSQHFPEIGQAIGDLATDSWENIKNIFSDFGWDTLLGPEGGDLIRGLGSGIWQALQSFWEPIGNALHATFIEPFKRLFGIASPSTLFAGFGGDIIQGLLNGVSAAVVAVWNFFSGVGSTIISFFVGAGLWLFNIGGELVRGLLNGATSLWNEAGNFFGNVQRFVWDKFIGVVDWLFNIGGELVRGMWNGIENFIRNNPLSNLFEDAVDGVKSFFGIESPSKLFHEFGTYIMMGLDNGLKSQQDAVAATLAETSGMMEDALAKDYVSSFMLDPSVARADFAAQTAALDMGGAGGNTYNETLNLEAITSADPAEVINEYVWQKRVRLRGGVNA